MRVVAILCLLVMGPAAAESHRGWLTGGGLALSGVGLVAASLGAYHAAQSDAANHALAAYYAHGAAPTATEAPAVRWLQERSDQMGATGLGLLIGGGASVLLGLALVLVDGWVGDVSVAVGPSGASVLFTRCF